MQHHKTVAHAKRVVVCVREGRGWYKVHISCQLNRGYRTAAPFWNATFHIPLNVRTLWTENRATNRSEAFTLNDSWSWKRLQFSWRPCFCRNEVAIFRSTSISPNFLNRAREGSPTGTIRWRQGARALNISQRVCLVKSHLITTVDLPCEQKKLRKPLHTYKSMTSERLFDFCITLFSLQYRGVQIKRGHYKSFLSLRAWMVRVRVLFCMWRLWKGSSTPTTSWRTWWH